MPPLVIVTEPLPSEADAWLAERATLVRARPGDPAFEAAIANAEALVVRTYTTVDARLLDRGPRLHVVARAGVGLDNIDQDACRARNIAVVHTPDANTTAVAEYVFSLLFRRARPIAPISEPMTLDAWEAHRNAVAAPRELNECTLGILGFGRIGSRVGRIARAFEMRVLFHDLIDIADVQECEPAQLDRVLAESDFLTIHVDGRSSNRNFIDAVKLARLKPDATLINTSRGFVIDESALAAWLADHPAAFAMLDVHATEPLSPADPLRSLINAELYAHTAAATRSAKRRMGWVVRQAWDVLAS